MWAVIQTTNVYSIAAHHSFTIGFRLVSLKLNIRATTGLFIMKKHISQLLMFAIYVMPTARHVLIDMTQLALIVPSTTSNGSRIERNVVIIAMKEITPQGA